MTKRTTQAPSPNYTQSPNVFFDEWLPEITSLSELKVVQVVIRYTFGWHVQEVLVSLSDIERLTNMTQPSAIEGIKRALEDGYIVRVKRGQSYGYRLNVAEEENDLLEGKLMALRFKRSSDGELSPERILLDVSTSKESIGVTSKESLDLCSPTSKESIGVSPIDSLEAPLKDFKRPYKDKESLKKEEINTHTQQLPAPDRKVCVCAQPHKSKFCYPERKLHAERNALGAGWLSKSADGTYDDLIADGLAGSSTSPEKNQTTHDDSAPPAREPAFNELAQYVRSRMSLGESPQTIIDGLEMREATRHKLISQFEADRNATPAADGSQTTTEPEKGN